MWCCLSFQVASAPPQPRSLLEIAQGDRGTPLMHALFHPTSTAIYVGKGHIYPVSDEFYAMLTRLHWLHQGGMMCHLQAQGQHRQRALEPSASPPQQGRPATLRRRVG